MKKIFFILFSVVAFYCNAQEKVVLINGDSLTGARVERVDETHSKIYKQDGTSSVILSKMIKSVMEDNPFDNLKPGKDSLSYDYAALTYSEGWTPAMDVYFSSTRHLDLMKKLDIPKQLARYNTLFIGINFLNKLGYELVGFNSSDAGTVREYLFKKKKN